MGKKNNFAGKAGRPAKIGNDRWVKTKTLCAEELGLGRRTLDDKLKEYPEGAPKPRSDGSWHVGRAKTWQRKWNIYSCPKGSPDQRAEKIQIELEHARLRLERDRFEFEQLKDKMIPISWVDLALTKMTGHFRTQLRNFGARVNEKIEGLDFNDRLQVIDQEIAVLERTFARCDYLNAEEGSEDDEEHG